MAKLQLEDILKGLESIPQEQRSSAQETANRISQIASMVGPEVVKAPKAKRAATESADLGSPQVARDIKDIKNAQSKLLDETKKTNSLLSTFLNNESKVFENNNELIERLLIAQEQERERKKTGETVAKTSSTEKQKDKEVGAVDFAAGAAGPLAFLFAFMPEIKKALESIPTEVRDAAVASGILLKRALTSLADTVETTASSLFKDIGERLGITKPAARAGERGAVSAAERKAAAEAAEKLKTKSNVTASENAPEPVVEDEEMKRRKNAEKSKSQNRASKAKPATAAAREAAEEVKPPAGKPMPKPTGAAAREAAAEGGAALEASLSKKLALFLGKNTVKAVAKTIPFVGAGVAAFSAYEDAGRGDFRGAIANSIATIGSLMSATGIGAAVGEPAAVAAMTEDLIDKAYTAVYSEDGKPADYWDDMKNNPKLFGERIAWLAPKVAEAVYKEMEEYAKNNYTTPADNPDQEAVYTPEGNVLYYQPKAQPTPDEGGTGRREGKVKPAPKPSAVNPTASGQNYTPLVAPVSRTAPRIDRDHTGGTVYNDNRTINNVDNSKAGGGGGSAPGFPNSSTAPRNPWDEPLYGAGMNLF